MSCIVGGARCDKLPEMCFPATATLAGARGEDRRAVAHDLPANRGDHFLKGSLRRLEDGRKLQAPIGDEPSTGRSRSK